MLGLYDLRRDSPLLPSIGVRTSAPLGATKGCPRRLQSRQHHAAIDERRDVEAHIFGRCAFGCFCFGYLALQGVQDRHQKTAQAESTRKMNFHFID